MKCVLMTIVEILLLATLLLNLWQLPMGWGLFATASWIIASMGIIFITEVEK